ncbi:MAG: iron-containing alcohol dehydrogenase [bacterium]
MRNFTFYNPTKLIFGTDAMDKIAEQIKPFGQKVLVTYGGGSIKKNGIYEKVLSQLKGFTVKEFGGIEPNPRVETIRKAIAEFKSWEPDFVLAVGGGSVIDGSKLLISAMYYEGDPWDYMITPGIEPAKYIPLGTVLTLAATGSEMNSGAVITNWDKNEKLVFGRQQAFPVFSILDPQNTFSVPADQTANGLVDAFSHVLEQYITTAENVPLQDRFCEGILMTLIETGTALLNDLHNYETRANHMFAATMALNNVIRQGTNEDWATHRIEHEISAFYDIPHGAGLAIITPRWMNVIKEQKAKKIIQYGKRVWGLSGLDEEIIKGAIMKTHDFFKSLGQKMVLSDWGVTDEHFPEMIERLVAGKIGEIPLNYEQIEAILISSVE